MTLRAIRVGPTPVPCCAESYNLLQVRLHQQVFSTGPVSGILAKVRDRLPALAAQAGVALIVSKWEMQFQNPKIETVDVYTVGRQIVQPQRQSLEMDRRDESPGPDSVRETTTRPEHVNAPPMKACKRLGRDCFRY